MAVPLCPSIFAGGIVHLYVGPSRLPLAAHMTLLCDHSPVLHKLLRDRFEDPEPKHLTLVGDDPKVFCDMLSFFYTRRISLEEIAATWEDFCDLWVMADKYQIPDFQNTAMVGMWKKWKENVGPDWNTLPSTIAYVYKRTIPRSELRRFFRDMCIDRMDRDRFWRTRFDFLTEFVIDFAIESLKRLIGQTNATSTEDPRHYFVWPKKENVQSNDASTSGVDGTSAGTSGKSTEMAGSSVHRYSTTEVGPPFPGVRE